jgi:hypothetical protein
MIFTGILAVSTVGLWGATIGLYFTGEKQINVAKETADTAGRQIGLAEQQFISANRPKLRTKAVWLMNSNPIIGFNEPL